jgi:hypothetical protein
LTVNGNIIPVISFVGDGALGTRKDIKERISDDTSEGFYNLLRRKYESH